MNRVNIAEEEVSGFAFEVMNNIRTVKVLGIRRSLLDILHPYGRTVCQDTIARAVVSHTPWCSSGWGQVFRARCGNGIMYGIRHGYYPVGFPISFYGYFDRIWASVDELAQVAQEFSSSQYSIARMTDILREPAAAGRHKDFPADWKKDRRA